MKFTNKVRLVVVGGALTAAGFANAAIDTSGVTAAMTDAGAAVAVVGAAALIVAVGVKVFKWIQRAL
jgi:hypothetical protein